MPIKRTPGSTLERSAEKLFKRFEDLAAEQIKIMAAAADKATQAIANSATSARAVVADDAANAIKILSVKNADGGSDHDNFLTFSAEVKIKLDTIATDIKDIKTGTAAQLADHELRLKKLEAKTANYFITLTLYSLGMGLMISLLVYHLIAK